MKLQSVLLLQLVAAIFGQPESCSREGAVKLATFNSNDLHAGIVEVCHDGYWGTICTDSLTHSWSEKNAHVACWNVFNPVTNKYPYSGALNAITLSTLPNSYKVPESVPIHYHSVMCDGTERTLANCSQIFTNTSKCTHDYDAAVVCRQSSTANDVRLVGSTTDGQGAVEMNVAGYGWVRLCPEAFDLSDVCNKLGYTSTTYQTYTISTNRDSLTKLSRTTVCVTMYSYYYYSYYDSYYESTSYKSRIKSYQSCNTEYTTVCNYAATSYAGVTCSNTGIEGSVRLYGGSDPDVGNVEVLYNGVWGAVCATGWNEDAGRLVCAQLGYDSNDDYISIGFTGRYSGQNYLKPIWLNNVSNCSHLTNKEITECSYTPPIGYGQGCSSANVATLQCDFVLTNEAIAGIVLGSLSFVVAASCVACCCVLAKKSKCLRRPRVCQRTNHVSVQSCVTLQARRNPSSANSVSQPGRNYPSSVVETRFIPASVPPSGCLVHTMVDRTSTPLKLPAPEEKNKVQGVLNDAPPAYNEIIQLPPYEVGAAPAYNEVNTLP